MLGEELLEHAVEVGAVCDLDAACLLAGEEPSLLGVHRERIGDAHRDKGIREVRDRCAPD